MPFIPIDPTLPTDDPGWGGPEIEEFEIPPIMGLISATRIRGLSDTEDTLLGRRDDDEGPYGSEGVRRGL